MNTPPKCLRCQAPMEKGFQVDHAHLASMQTGWISGDPKKSAKFLGMPISSHVGGEADALRLPITLFRCTNCGLLESYALPAEPSKK